MVVIFGLDKLKYVFPEILKKQWFILFQWHDYKWQKYKINVNIYKIKAYWINIQTPLPNILKI